MLRVGLTGGIGSGKSTVANLFSTRGATIIDTDEIAHDLVTPGQAAYRDIIDQFGKNVLDPSGVLDRSKLRVRVFENPFERERLESILHPRIRAAVEQRLNQIDAGYAIVVVPLLIETGFVDLVDRILVVDADEALQIERVAKRRGMTPADVAKIMAAQAARKQRLARADDVIVNNSGLIELEQRVAELHERYLSLAGS